MPSSVLYKGHVPRIRPFVGLLYDTAVAGPLDALTTPPYDVIDETDRDRYYDASPFNAIRLIRGRHLPGDDETTNRYSRAATTLREWRREGVLTLTPGPAVYPYEFGFTDRGRERTVRGVIAAVELEPFGTGVIPHERTMPGPERDRLALLRAVRANLSAVHAVYPGPCPAAVALIEAAAAGPPALETTDEAGTRHRLWVKGDGEAACRALGEQALMIADGHHRYSVAAAYQREMDAAAGPGPWDRMMMLLVDATSEDPLVLPIHRALLAGRPVAGPDALPDVSDVAGIGDPVEDLPALLRQLRDDRLTVGVIRLEDGMPTYRVAVLDGAPPTVRTLHEHVLAEVEHGDLAFVHDPIAAEAMVRSGSASAAFILPPTHVETVHAVISSGETLPEKSTYFWPKPRTGLVIRPFDP